MMPGCAIAAVPSRLQAMYPLIAQANAAWSFSDRLRMDYIGSAYRVRRDSDNAELDIGFVDNAVDVAALGAFVGAASGHVVRAYDQSGNGRDLAQTTVTLQPWVVDAGVLSQAGALPAARFNPAVRVTNLKRADSFDVTGSQAWTIATLWRPQDTGFLIVMGSSGTTRAIYKSDQVYGNQSTGGYVTFDASNPVWRADVVKHPPAAQVLSCTRRSNLRDSLVVDSRSGGLNIVGSSTVGSRYDDTSQLTGYLSTLVLFGSEVAAQATTTLERYLMDRRALTA